MAERTLPSFWWKSLPYFTLGGDSTKIHVMAVLRRRVDGTPTFLEPVRLHLQTLRRHLDRLVQNYFGKNFHPSNWFPFVDNTIQWGLTSGDDRNPGAFNLILPTTGTQLDAYPLLGVQDVFYEFDTDRGGEGKLVLYIPDRVLAESTLYMLQNAAITGDYIIQVFSPFLNASPSMSEWVVAPDLIMGAIGDVTVSQWPYKIEITFGDIGGIHSISNDKRQVYSGKAKDVFEQMARDMGVGILWLPWPSGPPSIDTKITVDVGGRPIRDTLFTYFQLLNLRWRMIRSPGGGIPALLVVWENKFGHDPYTTFFTSSKSDEASGFWSVMKGIGSKLTEYFVTARELFHNVGIYTEGVYNLVIPYYADPEEMKWVAERYANTDHGRLLSAIEVFAAGARLPDGDGEVGYWQNLAKRVADVMDNITFSHTTFHLTPIKDVLSFKFANPQSEAVKQMAAAFPGGVTNLKIEKKRAAEAARVVKAKRVGDKYQFVTPSGTIEAGPNDPVYIAYDPQEGTGGARVLPAGATQPGMPTPEGGLPQVFPYRLTLETLPMFGVWPGLPTYVAGFPPLDGGWEMHRVRIEIGATTQRQTVFLRSERMPLYAKVGG